MTALRLNLDRVHLSDEQFYQLCQNNRELQFELTPKGELIIINPQQQQIEIYRLGKEVEMRDLPTELSG
jgi:Uma2 family endonuclease